MEVAEALRTYETLSLNALPEIPPGSRLIGLLDTFRGNFVEPSKEYRKTLAIKLTNLVGYRWLVILKVLDLVKQPFRGVLPGNSIASQPRSEGIIWSAVKYMIDATVDSKFSPTQQVKFMERTAGNLGFRELDQQGRILREQKKAYTARIMMAMFGGIALIVPMLIMVLHPSRNTSVITTSVATFLFAWLLAVHAEDSNGKDVLAATAAYAAVLVVFVGSSSGGSGG